MDKSGKKLDFDHWLELAKDQSVFEQSRQAMIERVITQAPESQQDRLRRLQWRIDQERHLSDSPMGACIRISRMMWDQMVGSGGLIDHLGGLDGRLTHSPVSAFKGAEVIPFSPGQTD